MVRTVQLQSSPPVPAPTPEKSSSSSSAGLPPLLPPNTLKSSRSSSDRTVMSSVEESPVVKRKATKKVRNAEAYPVLFNSIASAKENTKLPSDGIISREVYIQSSFNTSMSPCPPPAALTRTMTFNNLSKTIDITKEQWVVERRSVVEEENRYSKKSTLRTILEGIKDFFVGSDDEVYGPDYFLCADNHNGIELLLGTPEQQEIAEDNILKTLGLRNTMEIGNPEDHVDPSQSLSAFYELGIIPENNEFGAVGGEKEPEGIDPVDWTSPGEYASSDLLGDPAQDSG